MGLEEYLGEDFKKQSKEDLEEETEIIEEEVENEYKDKYIRLLAEFDNFRNRTERDNQVYKEQALSSFIEELIPVLDNFHLAIKTLDSEDASAKGVSMIYNQLEKLLLANGLDIVFEENVLFDPNIHQAVVVEENDEIESDHIIETLHCGYILNGKVLKPSMVKVAK